MNKKTNKAVQYFTAEQLKKGMAMSYEQRLQFIEDFAKLHAANKYRMANEKKQPSKL